MDINQIVAELTAERNRIDQAIAALTGPLSRLGRSNKAQSSKSAFGKRTMNAAARARIGAAKKAWWAKQKGKSVSKKTAAPKKAAARKPMSPAARKKLSALAKARWAARKKAGATSL
jgi:hypothetical protein